jgi:adenylate cyclase
MAFPLPDKPSIDVLPFENMSNDKGQEYFADGLTEEIINGLSKVEHVFVIARSSTFTYKNKPVKVQQVAEEMGVRYVLEGSVRKTGDTVRITAQLVDALNGRHIFSERYDRDFKDILTVQDEITMKILTALQVVLTKGEAFQLLEKGTKNLEAYLKVLKAMQLKAQFNKGAVAIARRYAEEAIALDPAYAGGYSTLAGVIINETYVGAAKTPHAEAMQEALVMAEKAVNLEPSSSNSHEMLSLVYAFSQNPEKALSEAEKAVALSPSSAYAYHCMGAALMVAERFHEAIPIFQKSLRLSPIPHTSGVLGMLGTSYRFIGQYEDAIATYKRMSTLYPDNLYSHAMLASTYVTVGRDEEARAEAAEVLKIDPNFSLEGFVNAFLVKRNKKLFGETLNDLRKAGLK